MVHENETNINFAILEKITQEYVIKLFFAWSDKLEEVTEANEVLVDPWKQIR
jgi:hypothetical protein